MIHQPLGGAKGQATEIEIAAKNILKTREKLNRMLAENTGKPYEQVAEDTESDHWMMLRKPLIMVLLMSIITKRKIEGVSRYIQSFRGVYYDVGI